RRGRALIQHTSAVIGDHDRRRAGLLCLHGPLHGHDPFHDKRKSFTGIHDFAQLGDSFASRRGRHILQERRPAASTSIATAKAPASFTSWSFSCTVSRFQGLIVGIPSPPAFPMAAAAAFTTAGSVPSPV